MNRTKSESVRKNTGAYFKPKMVLQNVIRLTDATAAVILPVIYASLKASKKVNGQVYYGIETAQEKTKP